MNVREPARIALVGASGFGVIHRRNLARLEALGRTTLVAVADPTPPPKGELADHVRVYRDLSALLAVEDRLDVVIVSTPIHTHYALAAQALTAGADVYLEKPPVTSVALLERLRVAAAASGRLVQVGFQSLGSQAIPRLHRMIADGELGDIRAITAAGMWTRDLAYFSRSAWAGKRALGGVDVVDGVATNALSHAVATALAVAGVRRASEFDSLEVDLYRANDTESDDTTVVRLRRAHPHPDITCALTLCGPEEAEPYITVHGSEGVATFFYVLDEVHVDAHGASAVERFDRTDLLENLLDARTRGAVLLSSLEDADPYMAVLEAVRTSPPPHVIAPQWVDRVGEGPSEHLVVRDIETAIRRACAAEATFTELGLPWAVPADRDDTHAEEIRIGERAVASRRSPTLLATSLAPRPYLHPLRTLGGTTLSDHLALDHPWHLGVGVAIPDVDGVNFWGGPDYHAEDAAYRWGRTHGSITTVAIETTEDEMHERLSWQASDGGELLREERDWQWHAIDEKTWRLQLRFQLRAPHGDVTLSSPGSRGRAGAGYGGFFWRFAACEQIGVRTADAAGEDDVNGSVSPWLCWGARFDGTAASILIIAPPEAHDPWFVRVGEYPAVGSGLAWLDALTIRPDAPVTRTITAFVHDGELDDVAIARLA